MEISFVIPNRNNLKYFKWAYDSIRKNQGNHDVYICAAADACTDGTVEYYKSLAEKDSKFSFIINDGPERLGHTILYDRIVNELVNTDVFIIYHSDMYLCPGAIDHIEKNISEDSIVSLTRIEPPLHPPGPEKIIQSFGQEPEEFSPKEEDFLKWFNSSKLDRKGKLTDGIFAPWAMYKSKFQEIGGHDKLYRPQSKEDCVTGDRNIIYIENGIIKVNSIESLFLKYNHLSKVRDDGKELIDFQENNIEIYSATAEENGIVGSNKINKLLRNKSDKKLIKVTTDWAETVCTEDHSLLHSDLSEVKPQYLQLEHIWNATEIGDWTDSYVLDVFDIYDTLDYEFDDDHDRECITHAFSVEKDYDALMDICEYIGFYSACGTIMNSDIVITHTNEDLVRKMVEKSKRLFNIKNSDLKYNNISIVSMMHSKCSFSNKCISDVVKKIAGQGTGNHFIPTFIYNLPKSFQNKFLDGYFAGIYVTKELSIGNIIRANNSKLAGGLVYLIRKNTKFKTRIEHVVTMNYYNIVLCNSYNMDLLNLEYMPNIGYVYDLEINNSHTFIDAPGLFGLHNSDIFNRFVLNKLKTIQVWEGCVYHMTCRGSRYNPLLTKVGKESDEWLAQNNKSSRNFIRKWGSFVKHNDTMKPIVPERYDVGFVVKNCDEYKLTLLEPWCDTIYTDVNYSRYISVEQKNTDFDLSKKLKLYDDQKTNDIIVEFDANQLTNNTFEIFNMLSMMLADSGQIGEMEFDIFKLKINALTDYSSELINISSNWYQSKLK